MTSSNSESTTMKKSRVFQGSEKNTKPKPKSFPTTSMVKNTTKHVSAVSHASSLPSVSAWTHMRMELIQTREMKNALHGKDSLNCFSALAAFVLRGDNT